MSVFIYLISKEYQMPNSKPDFLDMDKDGNKEEPMKKAAAEKFKNGKVDKVKQMMRKKSEG